jgi:Fic family protein
VWLEGPGEDVPPMVRAALAHVWLAAVHPFQDGNGRTARITASLVMYRAGFRLPQFTSLEEWWGAHPAEYYSAFDCLGSNWDSQADVTPFVTTHVRAQRMQADALSLRQATERQLWAALEDIVDNELGMDIRAANALWEAFFGREVTNRYYRGIADIGQVTASHDLKQLQTSGLLGVQGGGQNTSYLGTPELVRRVVDVLRLPIDASGSGPLDADLRNSTIAALAAKVHGGI